MGLVETCRVVNCCLKLVLYSSDDKFVRRRLIRNLLRANSSVTSLLTTILNLLLLLNHTSRSTLLYISFEIEDIVLNGRERAVVAHVETCCGLLLLLLTVFEDLNLGAFDRGCVRSWSLLYVLGRTYNVSTIASIGNSFNSSAFIIKLLHRSRDYLHSLIEILMLSGRTLTT